MAAIDRMLCQVAEHFSHIGTEEIFMSVSYKKLWKLLIDKDMKKKDLCEKAGISPASVTVTTDSSDDEKGPVTGG